MKVSKHMKAQISNIWTSRPSPRLQDQKIPLSSGSRRQVTWQDQTADPVSNGGQIPVSDVARSRP